MQGMIWSDQQVDIEHRVKLACHASLFKDFSTMLFCNKNSSSVNTCMLSSLSCWRYRSCSRFFMRMSAILLGEHFTCGDSEEFCVGEKAFAMALAAFVKASESDSLRGCRWTDPVIRGTFGGCSKSSWVCATNIRAQSLSCGPEYSLPCLFFSCWNTSSSSSSFSLLLLSRLGFFRATFSSSLSSSWSLPSHHKLRHGFPSKYVYITYRPWLFGVLLPLKVFYIERTFVRHCISKFMPQGWSKSCKRLKSLRDIVLLTDWKLRTFGWVIYLDFV